MIEHHGFHVVGLEAGYEASWALSEWIRGKAGDVRVAVDRLGMWLWQTEELVEFASWLRAENARRSPEDADSFFLPSRAASGERWPGPVRYTRNIGASYAPSRRDNYWSPLQLASAYDAIVYVPQVEAAVERPWAKQP